MLDFETLLNQEGNKEGLETVREMGFFRFVGIVVVFLIFLAAQYGLTLATENPWPSSDLSHAFSRLVMWPLLYTECAIITLILLAIFITRFWSAGLGLLLELCAAKFVVACSLILAVQIALLFVSQQAGYWLVGVLAITLVVSLALPISKPSEPERFAHLRQIVSIVGLVGMGVELIIGQLNVKQFYARLWIAATPFIAWGLIIWLGRMLRSDIEFLWKKGRHLEQLRVSLGFTEEEWDGPLRHRSQKGDSSDANKGA